MSNQPYSHLPMRTGLAISGHDPRRIYFMLRGYYDGSGKSDDGSAYLTLTGMVASESVWERFEVAWGKVLERHNAPVFHMKDAMALKKNFDQKKGWIDVKVNELVTDLFKVLAAFRPIDGPSNSNLIAMSCTVVMEDYRRAKNSVHNLKEPEAICVDFCVGGGVPHDIDPIKEGKRPGIVLVFDRNECFQKMITRVWQDLISGQVIGWPEQIVDIVDRDKELVAVGTSNICPLQASDLLAWLMNKRHSSDVQDRIKPWLVQSAFAVAHSMKIYDYPRLMAKYGRA